MAKHAKQVCFKKNETCSPGELIFVSWFITGENTKGAWFCPKHDMQETSNYLGGK